MKNSISPLLLIFFLAIVVSVATADSRNSWHSKEIPHEIRQQLHHTVKDLPSFPFEDPVLLSPQNWPPRNEFDGINCGLELTSGQHDAIERISSITDRRPGWSLSARYLCDKGGYHKEFSKGPAYSWRPDNTLTERSYKKSNGIRFSYQGYQYDNCGNVYRFFEREQNEDLSGPFRRFSEIFYADGRLLAFDAGWSAANINKPTVFQFWDGRAVDKDTYMAKYKEYLKDIKKRDCVGSNAYNKSVEPSGNPPAH